MRRRQALLTSMAAVAAPRLHATEPPLDLTTPPGGLTALVKAMSSLDPAQETILWASGTGYGVSPDGARLEPWLRVDMLIAMKTMPAAEGYRQLSNQLVLFSDLKSGDVIDTWRNPVTDETIPVFHGHNGPINIELKPYQMRLGADGNTKEQVPFILPWKDEGTFVTLATELKSRRRNPLDPQKWRREYTGAWVESTEFSQWTCVAKDLKDTATASVDVSGSIQRFAAWYPWMLMERRPGGFVTRMTARKIKTLDQLDRSIRDYAEERFPGYLRAPKEWTGEYVDVMTVFEREWTPAK